MYLRKLRGLTSKYSFLMLLNSRNKKEEQKNSFTEPKPNFFGAGYKKTVLPPVVDNKEKKEPEKDIHNLLE